MLRCCLDMASNKNNKGERETKIENSTSTETSQISSPQQQYGQYQDQQQQQRREQEEEEQHHAINQALDETKDNIRKTTDEARSQIPRYTQSVNDYQEQTIQAAREIADNYLESQKEIINSFQSACTPYMENANMVSSFADNTIAATRLVNNAIFANMDAFKTSIQHAKENAKEFSRIGVNAAKTFEQTSRDADRSGNTVSGFSVETEGRQRRY